MFSAPQFFKLLRGQWQVNRTIINALADKPLLVEGTAVFKDFLQADGETALIYQEEVTIQHSDGQKTPAYQSYYYTLNPPNISVFFYKNEKQAGLFHNLFFDQITQDLKLLAHHPCGKDMHQIQYQLSKELSFSITYTVNGPKNNYVSTTIFKKQDLAQSNPEHLTVSPKTV